MLVAAFSQPLRVPEWGVPAPPRFDPEDPLLARVRQAALALPGAQEKVSVGHPTLFTKEVFAWYAMSHKEGAKCQKNPQAVSLLLPHDLKQALLARPDTYVPGYIGSSGWIGIRLHADTDWRELEDLLRESFRLTAPRALIGALDGA